MIFYWLIVALRRLRWLFVLPPAQEVARVDPNAKCPACGATSGKLAAVQDGVGAKAVIVVEHTCNVCAARFFEKTVLNAGPDRIRTEHVVNGATVTRMAA